MNRTDEDQPNELMDEEDQLQEEMQEEFRKRLKKRLQKRVKAKEEDMDEVRSLKKKGRSSCD